MHIHLAYSTHCYIPKHVRYNMIDDSVILNLDDPILYDPGLILCMRPDNGRRRYIVTSSLIGWAHTQNEPCDNKYYKPK